MVKPRSFTKYDVLLTQYGEINIIRFTQSFMISKSYQSEQGLTCSLYWLKEGGGSLIPVLLNRGLTGYFNITKVENLELDNCHSYGKIGLETSL